VLEVRVNVDEEGAAEEVSSLFHDGKPLPVGEEA
jgi:hypothetical protein